MKRVRKAGVQGGKVRLYYYKVENIPLRNTKQKNEREANKKEGRLGYISIRCRIYP
ncbi:hypothetical protein E2C01_067911 [Portunus trituberculatus]|uniref:Uncharacterized protein n=1 Tax=Portunus trituberculatus TaxID=210409 RepID=A0A5B7HWG3_PORTR|nr:hypothetical protein [Portunus trituberculatus]